MGNATTAHRRIFEYLRMVARDRQIGQEQIWTALAGPEGVRPMDGPNNLTAAVRFRLFGTWL
jgi:hypothetical protein